MFARSLIHVGLYTCLPCAMRFNNIQTHNDTHVMPMSAMLLNINKCMLKTSIYGFEYHVILFHIKH